MRILMLGGSSVGKTTLMVSTYGMMSRAKFKGFHVKCKNNTTHNKLTKAYDRFCQEGKYPDGTVVQMEAYEYDFYSDSEWVMNFTLTDIRGESVRDYDTEKLRREIRQSDAVMLFFNGYDVAYEEDMDDALLDLMPLLNSGFDTDHGMRMLMPVFTQMDRISDFSQEHWDNILKFSNRFTDAAKQNDNLLCQIVPTACAPECMMDLDFMMVTLMLFGYTAELLKRKQAQEAELKKIQDLWGAGFGRDIIYYLFGDKKRDEAARRAKELSKDIDYFNNVMQPKFDAMKKFYDDYELFTFYSVSRKNSNTVWDL